MPEISLADAVKQSLTVIRETAEATEGVAEEKEIESVFVCKSCGAADPWITEMGDYRTSGKAYDQGARGFGWDAWDTDYEFREYETDCCYTRGESLEEIMTLKYLPVDR